MRFQEEGMPHAFFVMPAEENLFGRRERYECDRPL